MRALLRQPLALALLWLAALTATYAYQAQPLSLTIPVIEEATYAYETPPRSTAHPRGDHATLPPTYDYDAATIFQASANCAPPATAPTYDYDCNAVFLAAKSGVVGAGDDLVTVYRGVHPKHPDLPSALQGRANPIGGHADATLHNAGNNQSVFTSWTTDRATAFDFAVGKYSGFDDAGGVLLQQRVPRSSLIKSPDAFGEFEVLRSGPVSGATPIIISR
jgi:hypothetical protein